MNLNRTLNRHPLITAIYEAALAVEACGASHALTAASIKVNALMDDAHDLLDQLEARPATIALPVVDLGQSLANSEADTKPLATGAGPATHGAEPAGIVVDGIMAMADEYAQAPNAAAAAELRRHLQTAVNDLRADVGPKPGVMHPVDEAFHKMTVLQRDQAWAESARLKATLGTIQTAVNNEFSAAA